MRVQDGAHGSHDFFLAGEAASADHAAREIAFVWSDDANAAVAQETDIFLRGGVIPHVYVHGGSDDYRRGAGQVKRGEKIVGDATGEFGENIGGGRGYEEQIGSLGYGDVFDGAFQIGFAGFGIAEKIGDDFLSA